ncbi:MAG TPA: hypothetical protein PKA64_19310 [Myxococcota bacterium]|nr:hypothetical protein [Myxococcota bacterium]
MSNLICLLLGILIPLFTLAWIARRGLRPVAAAASCTTPTAGCRARVRGAP